MVCGFRQESCIIEPECRLLDGTVLTDRTKSRLKGHLSPEKLNPINEICSMIGKYFQNLEKRRKLQANTGYS